MWLPLWPIERMSRATPAAVPDDLPLALIEPGSHGIRITAVNAKAAEEGVRVGQALADARAALPALLSRPAEPRRDRLALLKLARWCGRYGPNRNVDGADGLWIENGELTYPVEEVTIAGNLAEMLSHVALIGSDLEFRSALAAPTVLVEGLTVAGV